MQESFGKGAPAARVRRFATLRQDMSILQEQLLKVSCQHEGLLTEGVQLRAKEAKEADEGEQEDADDMVTQPSIVEEEEAEPEEEEQENVG